MARKKKQEVILLHGNSQFNMAAAEAVSLKQGELVIEHGKINVNDKDEAVTKIHTIDNTGAELATFIDEKAINKLVNDVDTKVETLEGVVGDEDKGLVKKVNANEAAISDLQNALGMGGTSGTGVTARVDALEGVVGDESKGLVKDVKDLQSELNTETTGIKDRLDAVEDKADANADEITALKETLNGKGEDTGLVDKVAANEEAIGTNADEIAKLKGYVVDGYTPEGEDAEKVNGLLDRVTVLENLMGDADGKGSIVDRVAGAESKITNLETLVGSEDDGLVKDVDDLQSTVGDKTRGLVKDVNDLETTVSGHTTKINEIADAVGTPSVPGEGDAEGTPATGLFADVEANTAAIESLEAQIGTDIEDALGELNEVATEGEKLDTTYVSYVEQENGLIKPVYKTLDAANVKATYPKTGGTETTVQAALDDLNATDLDLGGQIEAVDARIDALLGKTEANNGDDGKTIRKIANEELTKQLIPENAAEALNSLEEIAAWIQNHPEDAAAMNLEIENLQSVVANVLEDFVTVTTDDDNETIKTLTAVKKIKDSLQALTNEDIELNNAITALTETVTGNTNAITDIKNYTVNDKKISENPVLDSTNIKMKAVVGSTADTQTVQEAIAQVNQNITTEVNLAKESLTNELNKVNVTGVEGGGVDVVKTDRTFTISITKIDAGSYDNDGTTEE